ncbi:MAG: hypothetical protein KAW89_03505 [Armatimonadetes bacterium]|nr:hypothetical protein [Armatimonadota bacterium]
MRLRMMLMVALFALGLHSFASADNLFDGRYKSIGSTIRGVKSSITTSPEPDLHEGEFSCAWCMASKHNPTRYAQAGYMMKATEANMKKFAEWVDTSGNWHRTLTGTPGSGDHTWECIQDGTTKVWTFKYGGTEFANSSGYNTNWDGCIVEFFGEVVPDGTVQMVGDSTHKVKFTTFRYLPAGCTTWTTVWPSSYRNDRPLDWGQDVSQANGYFKIWDTTP